MITVNDITEVIKLRIEKPLQESILTYKEYSDTIHLTYEVFSFGTHENIIFSIVFKELLDQDDHGYDICFDIYHSDNFLKTYLGKSDGALVLNPRTIMTNNQSFRTEFNDLIEDYFMVSFLLIKQYILDFKFKEK